MSDQPMSPPLLGPAQPVQWPPVHEPAVDEHAAAVRAEAEAVLDQANRMHREAEQNADRILRTSKTEADRARAEAQRVLDQAQAAADTKAKRAARVDEWGPRVALAATIALTASGEFALAQLAGWTAWIAWALPTAIDVYVVQAFRRHRDVPGAIILMIAANALYHLAERGLFGVATAHGEIVRNAHGEPRPEWWLIVGVAAIAPWVMWRIHRITAPPKERQKPVRETAVETPAPVTVERVETPAETRSQATARPALEAGETGRETSPKPPETKPRETKPKPRPRRETKPRETRRPQVSPIGDIDKEIDELVGLMHSRGDAKKVTLDDAIETTGRSKATAARRLETARQRYLRETA